MIYALDCEVYPNYFLIVFKSLDRKTVIEIDIVDGKLKESQKDDLISMMSLNTTFGFNSFNYDIPIILCALLGQTTETIYKLSEYIIEGKNARWKTMKQFELSEPKDWKHFDIQEATPGVFTSLKLYGARMHSRKLQDLPIEPGTSISKEQIERIRSYCANDLDVTIDLYKHIEKRIFLRKNLSRQYNTNFLSKSDAQIAEGIITLELTKTDPEKSFKPPKINQTSKFKYKIPEFIEYENEELKSICDYIVNYDYQINSSGSLILPDKLKNTHINLGGSKYQLGLGGIHSMEKKQSVVPNSNEFLIDKDVESYYPNIILSLGLYPKHLGENFLDVYRTLVEARLKAKRAKNKNVDESLKIAINGSFGKLASKYSILYSPEVFLTIVLTGQLCLLMLIEQLQKEEINVISANTDGFVSHFEKSKYETYENVCFDWELQTGFKLSETYYKGLYSRDVNNYLALTTENKIKGKGIFTTDGLNKNPQAEIIIIAIKKFLLDQISIETTIMSCRDISKFLFVRSVTGGAIYENEYLGRAIRWIYSTNGNTITYKKNGNKVAKSDNSRPIMELGEFPCDIDYDRYLNETCLILRDIGVNNNSYVEKLTLR